MIKPDNFLKDRGTFTEYLRANCSSFEEVVELAAEQLAELGQLIDGLLVELNEEGGRASLAEKRAEAERAYCDRALDLLDASQRDYADFRERISLRMPKIVDRVVDAVDDAVANHIEDAVKRDRSALSAKGGRKKFENSSKRAGKAFVKECWREWQSKPSLYGGKAAFARDMLDKREELKSAQVIEGWCRDWERNGDEI